MFEQCAVIRRFWKEREKQAKSPNTQTRKNSIPLVRQMSSSSQLPSAQSVTVSGQESTAESSSQSKRRDSREFETSSKRVRHEYVEQEEGQSATPIMLPARIAHLVEVALPQQPIQLSEATVDNEGDSPLSDLADERYHDANTESQAEIQETLPTRKHSWLDTILN